MKVELSKDPLFDKKESPVRGLKQKELQRQRQMRIMRMNPRTQKIELNYEIIDPLPEELKTFRSQFDYKKTTQPSKASYNLKKYIIEQQRNLKCLRLERIEENEEDSEKKRRVEFKFDLEKSKRRSEKKSKEINIPCVDELFKDQQKEYVLYQSKQMKNSLNRAIQSIDNTLNTRLKSNSLLNKTVNVIQDNKKTDRSHLQANNHSQLSNQSAIHGNHSVHNSHSLPKPSSPAANDQDIQIDELLEKKLKRSEKLVEKLYKQKKQMMNQQHRSSSFDNKNLNFFAPVSEKKKKKVKLEGVRQIPYIDGEREMKITPASILMFQMSHQMSGRERKQVELSGLLQNSFQNREAILFEKQDFYEKQTPFNHLSPSNQFRLRQIMDKKLRHRLQLSKQQVDKFVSYLYEIKDQYHVILDQTILQVLKQVRKTLLSGKVMKKSDFKQIITTNKNQLSLKGNPNQQIIQNLQQMMI